MTFAFMLVSSLRAAPAYAQTVVVTNEDYRAIAEVVGAIALQGPCCGSAPDTPDIGVALSAALYPGAILGIVGEASVYANLWTQYEIPYGRTNAVRATLAGARLRSPLINGGNTKFRLFGQLLGGPQWTAAASRTLVLQPGAGADAYLRGGLVLHVEYDYRFAPDDHRTFAIGRFMVGIGVPIGSR